MPARSKVLTLPDEIKAALDKRLVSGGFADYVALSAWLEEQGCQISKSALHRYGQEFEERIAAIKIATEQAQAIAEAAGDDQGALNDALIRLCQEKAFQVLIKMQAESEAIDFDKLGLLVARIGRVSVTQKKWMAEAREKAEKTAEEVTKVARTGGLSPEKVAKIKKSILGIV